MSFKRDAVVFGICVLTAVIVMQMALPWAEWKYFFQMLGYLIEYPFLLVILGGIIIAGFVSDRMD